MLAWVASVSRLSSHARPEAVVSPVLRLRGDRALEERLRPAAAGEAGRLELSLRDPVILGDAMRIEISFGPLADEVELEGTVVGLQTSQHPGPRTVVLAFGRDQGPQLRYLRHVLAGRRSASARRYRRVPTDLAVRWRDGRTLHACKTSDLSRGGAFIVSRICPRVGEEVEVELVTEGASVLCLQAVVSWVRGDASSPGFGVSFKLTDRAAAAALDALVRRRERSA